MIYLITFTFDIVPDEHKEFVGFVEQLQNFWELQGIHVTLYRDSSNRNRFMQIFLTEKSLEDLTQLIQGEAKAKAVFEKIKESESRIIVSCFEKVL